MSNAAAPPPERAPGRLQGLGACRAALRETLLALTPSASIKGTASVKALPAALWCIDRDFAAWPFDDLTVQQSLADWLSGSGRRLVLLGVDFDTTAARLPRFARWRRDHAHRIDVWRPVDGYLPGGLRGLLAIDAAWQWLESDEAQLRWLGKLEQRIAYRAEIADYLQQCEPAWPVTTLGL